MINPTIFSRSLKGRCYGDRFLAPIGIPHLHCVRWHSTTDGRVASLLHSLIPSITPPRLTKMWSLIHYTWVLQAHLCRADGLHAGLCHVFLVLLQNFCAAECLSEAKQRNHTLFLIHKMISGWRDVNLFTVDFLCQIYILRYSIKYYNITYFSKLAQIPRHFSLYLIWSRPK